MCVWVCFFLLFSIYDPNRFAVISETSWADTFREKLIYLEKHPSLTPPFLICMNTLILFLFPSVILCLILTSVCFNIFPNGFYLFFILLNSFSLFIHFFFMCSLCAPSPIYSNVCWKFTCVCVQRNQIVKRWTKRKNETVQKWLAFRCDFSLFEFLKMLNVIENSPACLGYMFEISLPSFFVFLLRLPTIYNRL